jgi:uncharacterized protein YcbK (DUF882 family)
MLGLAAGTVLAGTGAERIVAAGEGARTIAFKHIHTNETLSIVYKKDGKHLPEALEKINWIMRDWRKNEVVKIDPATIDLLWEMHTELGSREPISIICGYRSNDTNEMLRRTVGGQASQSQHITGKAIDVTFPDVPLKKIRYSALVRERGGVGYYPTSGIPFVHVDTASVRHWPRLPRYELALLFPNGSTRYQAADGGSITREDVRVAQSQHKSLAVEIAQYLQDRTRPKTSVMVADAGSPPASAERPAGVVQASLGGAPKPAPRPETVVAALDPRPAPQTQPSAPQLVAAPKLVERSSRLTPGPLPVAAPATKQAPAKPAAVAAASGPSSADKSKLDALAALAALEPPSAPEAPAATPKLVAAPRPAVRPQPSASQSIASAGPTLPAPPIATPPPAPKAPQVAALAPEQQPGAAPRSLIDSGWGTGWVPAPAYDEEHPEELSYRPFPVAPLLTATASADDPVLVRLEHPDVAKTLEVIDDGGAIQPLRFFPGQQVAQVMWAQQFQGQAVHLPGPAASPAAALPGLTGRKVKTSSR